MPNDIKGAGDAKTVEVAAAVLCTTKPAPVTATGGDGDRGSSGSGDSKAIILEEDPRGVFADDDDQLEEGNAVKTDEAIFGSGKKKKKRRKKDNKLNGPTSL